MSKKALDTQVGGSHYKNYKIQPIEYITKAGLSFIQGNIVKYIIRHRDKNGAEDVKKVVHYAQLAKEMYHVNSFRERMQIVHKYTLDFIEQNEISEKEAEILLLVIQNNWERIEIIGAEILTEYAGLHRKEGLTDPTPSQ